MCERSSLAHMPPSPPTEAQHFRGNPLSPESPIPRHLPEPQNIPVLEKQIDPVFNLMSTHLDTPVSQEHRTGLTLAPKPELETMHPLGEETSSGAFGRDHGPASDERGKDLNTAQDQRVLQDPDEFDKDHNHLTSNAQSSVSPNIHESPSVSAQNNHPLAVPSQNQNHPEARSEQYGLYRQVPEYATPRADTSKTAAQISSDLNAPTQTASEDVKDECVNYQTLLENLAPPVSIPPATEDTTASTVTDNSDVSKPLSPGSAQTSLATLPLPVGLPARPPPQDKPAIHPNYAYGEDIRSYHNPTALSTNTPASQATQASNSYRPAQNYPTYNGAAPNGMAPPPPATFQQLPTTFNKSQRSPQLSQPPYREDSGRNASGPERSYLEGDGGHPRIPEVEKAFDEFLHDEANYTSQGQWEKFPPGSRLFVGNLFTEKVSKRDLFYIFSRYGRLAQISIKSAYGFIQYVQAEDCHRAMQSEQGLQIRGRKINLEISKPQKNTRNAAAAIAQGNELRAAFGRRSRSPEYNRGNTLRGSGPRNGPDRFDRGHAYNEIRGRDDYRPMRSPSPRGSRMIDSYRGGRDRSPDYYRGGRRTRSRSPPNRGSFYRDRSPGPGDPDDEAALPIARRPPGGAPDVQIILAEEVDRTFVGYIQQSFRDRSLRCEVLQLPRVSMVAVVKRQILEGVQAVVKIFRRSQVTGKIPLQVFNRSQGLNDVQFDEYEDLDAATAAEIVVRAKSTHMAPPQTQSQFTRPSYPTPQYGPSTQPSYPPQNGPPQQIPPQQPPAGGLPSSVANTIGALDGPALQKLLASMSQNSQASQLPQNLQTSALPGQNPDLAAILSSVTRQQAPPSATPLQGYQQPPSQGYLQQGTQQQGYQQQRPQQPGYPPYSGSPQPPYPQNNNQAPHNNFQNHPVAEFGTQQVTRQQQQQQQQPPNVQEIMAQLARYGQR